MILVGVACRRWGRGPCVLYDVMLPYSSVMPWEEAGQGWAVGGLGRAEAD